MVTYDEYLSYFECFKIHISKIETQDCVLHYLVDSVIVENFIGCNTVHVCLSVNKEIDSTSQPYWSCGNIVHHKIEHPTIRKHPALKRSGYWSHNLPDIDLKEIRFSILGCSLESSLLLFRQIYDDYRMRTETFTIYDLQIRYQ